MFARCLLCCDCLWAHSTRCACSCFRKHGKLVPVRDLQATQPSRGAKPVYAPAVAANQVCGACRSSAGRCRLRADRLLRGTGPAGKESTESLFVRELKRRGLETNQVSADAAEEGAPSSAEAAKPLTPPQLAKSRALAYEGLEGLLPRAKELVKLGGSFFLGFGPLILLLLALSAGTYAVRTSPQSARVELRPAHCVFPLTS